MNRREFWKFFAAAPVAVVAPLLGAKELTQVEGAAVFIESDASITIKNLTITNGGGLTLRKGTDARLGNVLIHYP